MNNSSGKLFTIFTICLVNKIKIIEQYYNTKSTLSITGALFLIPIIKF